MKVEDLLAGHFLKGEEGGKKVEGRGVEQIIIDCGQHRTPDTRA